MERMFSYATFPGIKPTHIQGDVPAISYPIVTQGIPNRCKSKTKEKDLYRSHPSRIIALFQESVDTFQAFIF